MKRYVFDLDGTLLTGSFDFEHEYFKDVFGDGVSSLVNNMGVFLDEYERKYPRYNNDTLSSFLKSKSGLDFTPDIIDGWCDAMIDVPDAIEDGIYEVLEELKRKGHSLAVLTNWYGKTQIPRLERANMIKYFDDIYTGDTVLKPHKCSFIIARKDFNHNNCVFIGDNLEKDYIGPRACGMKSILYDKNDTHHKALVKIKRLNELIDR